MSDIININSDGVIKFLDNLEQDIAHPEPLMAEISEILMEGVMENMDNEQGPSGSWPDLSPVTKAQRKEKGYWPGLMLERTHTLKDSLQHEYDDETAQVATNLEYAAIHQYGGKAGRNKKVTIPPRPYLWVSSDTKDEIMDAVQDYISGLLEQ